MGSIAISGFNSKLNVLKPYSSPYRSVTFITYLVPYMAIDFCQLTFILVLLLSLLPTCFSGAFIVTLLSMVSAYKSQHLFHESNLFALFGNIAPPLFIYVLLNVKHFKAIYSIMFPLNCMGFALEWWHFQRWYSRSLWFYCMACDPFGSGSLVPQVSGLQNP